jgi:hypothetical protein
MSSKWQGYFDKGKEVEKRFANVLSNLVWATREEDRHEHWDVSGKLPDKYLTDDLDNSQLKFDVKGLKKINRFDKGYQDELAWIEIKNVLGLKGWVCGNADYIVFERTDSWLLVKREDLLDLADSRSKSLGYPVGKKPYHLYNRSPRKDKLTLVPFSDIMSLTSVINIPF